MAKLEKLKKPDSMKGLSGLGKTTKLPPLPKPQQQAPRVENLVDQALMRLTDVVGDEKLAKRILKLKEKYPDASTLECAMMEYFDRKGIRYIFQQTLLGGRKVRYGQVVDFLIDKGAYVLVIEAQGNYWHTRRGKPQVDAAQRLALLGTTYRGKPIQQVVEVWESRIMQPKRSMRERTMSQALSGIGLGK